MKKPTEYIKEAWKIYTTKKNFVFFAKIMAVLVIVTTTAGFLLSYFYPFQYPDLKFDYSDPVKVLGVILLLLLSAIAGLWSEGTRNLSLIKMNSDEKELFKLGFAKLWKFFTISLVIGFVIIGGLLLLVIPAVIFGVRYSFARFLVLDKNLGVKEALKKSSLMVSGKFWKIFGRLIVFGLFSLSFSVLLTTIPYIGAFLVAFIAPLYTLPFYLLYKDLSIN